MRSIEKKRILFVATRPINPNKDGRTMVLDQYCSLLNKELEFDVYYAGFDLVEEQPTYLSKVLGMKRPSLIELGFNLLIYTFVLRKYPIQSSMMFCRKSKRSLDSFIDQIKPDIIICDMVRLVPYINTKNKCYKKVLNMDELISKRYHRQLKEGNTDGSVLGQYRNKYSPVMINALVRLGIMKKLLRLETRLVERAEIETPKLFDRTFFVSPNDMKEFEDKTGIKGYCVHVALNEKYINEPISDNYDPKLIGYFANIDAAPGRDSLHYLIDEVVAKLHEQDSEFRLLVIGKCSDDTYKEFQKYLDYVEFTFWVDNVYEYASKCCAIVVPVLYGSGIKTKIIQSLSMGLPVITNDVGAEGLSTSQFELIICDESKEYVSNIERLSINPTLRKEFARNGREYVLANHSRETQKEDLRELFSDNIF